MSFQLRLGGHDHTKIILKAMDNIFPVEDFGRQVEESGVSIPLVQPVYTSPLSPELVHLMKLNGILGL